MRITLLLTLSLLLTNIYGQDTFSEFDKSNEGFEIEKMKNSDLQLIKEIYRDKSGKTVRFYNYNPTTGALDGDFDNGLYFGSYKNGLITSDNYIHFLNPSSDSKVLIIKGKIVAGKLNGTYNVTLRSYDTHAQYDHASTVLNSYIRGEYTKTYSTYVNWTKFTDKIVGEMNFENGLYSSYSFINENKKYAANFKNGLLDYYIIKDLSNNRNIDSFKVAGKIYLQNGMFQKNIYPSLVDSLDKLKKSSNSLLDYNSLGFDKIHVPSFSGTQPIPSIDPLNLKFEVNKRKVTSSAISFIENDLTKINFIPVTTTSNGEWLIVGVGSETASWEKYTYPSDVVISKCVTNEKIMIPFFEFTFDIKKIIELYGTVNGYKMLNQLYSDLPQKNLEILNDNYSNSKPDFVTFTYNDGLVLCEKTGQKLSEFQNIQLQATKKREEAEAKAAIEAKAKPQYIGGQLDLRKFLSQNTNYPQTARDEGIKGTIIIELFVSENGSIDHYEIKQTVPNGAALEKEAIRVIKLMPKWMPGEIDGKKIISTIDIPFRFN